MSTSLNKTSSSYNYERDPNTLYLIRNYKGNTKALEIAIPIVPESFNLQYSPNYASSNILGRMTPIYQYTGASGVSYSFSIKLHEDIHTKGQSLQELVDDIRSLSYPHISKGEEIDHFPSVLFFLGDIDDKVIVETDINWELPFRDGRYIVATINFNLKRVEKLDEVISKNYEGDYEIDTDNYVIIKYSGGTLTTQSMKDNPYDIYDDKQRYNYINIEEWDASKDRFINIAENTISIINKKDIGTKATKDAITILQPFIDYLQGSDFNKYIDNYKDYNMLDNYDLIIKALEAILKRIYDKEAVEYFLKEDIEKIINEFKALIKTITYAESLVTTGATK